MPVINTTGWMIDATATPRVLATPSLVLPVYVRRFHGINSGYCIIFPSERVNAQAWTLWVNLCRQNASFDPDNKFWVWSWRRAEAMTTDPATPIGSVNLQTVVEDTRKRARESWMAKQKEFDDQAAQISALENVPESEWPNYQYPSHYTPRDPHPVALQRIIVSKYWDKEGSLICAAVGTGKSRMVVDILSARALDAKWNTSVKIILLIAPLSLHENWRREFKLWTKVDFRCHRYLSSKKDWAVPLEIDAFEMFEASPEGTANGLVLICTPQALARLTFVDRLAEHNIVPTGIIVDEIHKSFRNTRNRSYKTLMLLRQKAHFAIGLSGTPTNKLVDFFALEEFIGGGKPNYHCNGAVLMDYAAASDTQTFKMSGLYQEGMTYDNLVKSFHIDRIKRGHIFMADKNHYLKDSLPSLDQQDIGPFGDMRLTFHDLVSQYPREVAEALEFHKLASQVEGEEAKDFSEMSEHTQGVTLMLRMSQVAAMSPANIELLEDFVENILEPDEPAVIWTLYRNDPARELDAVKACLANYGTVEHIAGDIIGKDSSAVRQAIVDRLQSGATRFLVAHPDSSGEGFNMTRPCKTLFMSIPLSYLKISQAIGRLHRLGQKNDVTAYFAMTHPIACFARHIYDNRKHVNEIIPRDFHINALKK